MPDISGFDVVGDLRKKSHMPIIVSTAKGDNIGRVIGLDMGADHAVPKPYYSRDLVTRLPVVLRRFYERPDDVDDEIAICFNELPLSPSTCSRKWSGMVFDLNVAEFNL